MNMKLFFAGTGLCLLLAAGCGTDKEAIYFASAAKMPAAMAEPSPVPRGLSKADEAKIDIIVFSNLLARHLWKDGDCTALFLQAEDAVVETMIKQFPNHNPPIKPSIHIDLRSNQSPLDKDTGKPVMILGADVSDPNADGTVDVVGRWYAGGAVQGFNNFKLKKTGEDWLIVSGP